MLQYRNVHLTNALLDDDYGIEGEYYVTIFTSGETLLLEKDSEKFTPAALSVKQTLLSISQTFNNVKVVEYDIFEDRIEFLIAIDLYGKKLAPSQIHYSIISDFNISVGVKIAPKNPLLVEGSLLHIISWFKTLSALEATKVGKTPFKWHSGYYDFRISDKHSLSQIKKYILKNPHQLLQVGTN